MTKTFKNTKFVKRNYDATNIIYCTAETAPNAHWEETDEVIPYHLDAIYMRGGVTFYGYL